MKKTVNRKDQIAAFKNAETFGPHPWGKRLLGRIKVVNGRKFQLHATKGWKCIGRAAQ